MGRQPRTRRQVRGRTVPALLAPVPGSRDPDIEDRGPCLGRRRKPYLPEKAIGVIRSAHVGYSPVPEIHSRAVSGGTKPQMPKKPIP